MCPTIGDSPGPVPEGQVQATTVKVCQVISREFLALKRVCHISHTIVCSFIRLAFLGSRNALLGHFRLNLDDGLPASRLLQPFFQESGFPTRRDAALPPPSGDELRVKSY